MWGLVSENVPSLWDCVKDISDRKAFSAEFGELDQSLRVRDWMIIQAWEMARIVWLEAIFWVGLRLKGDIFKEGAIL